MVQFVFLLGVLGSRDSGAGQCQDFGDLGSRVAHLNLKFCRFGHQVYNAHDP